MEKTFSIGGQEFQIRRLLSYDFFHPVQLICVKFKMCKCFSNTITWVKNILNYACCVCRKTDITFLFLWNFTYAFIDALLQLADFGTDIYAIDQYSKKCHAPFDEQQFNESVLAFKNQTSMMDNDSWTNNDVKKYLVYLMDDRDQSGWLSRNSQCGYFYASIPPMLIPTCLLLIFVLCSPKWRQTLNAYKVLFLVFSPLCLPVWTIYLLVTGERVVIFYISIF